MSSEVERRPVLDWNAPFVGELRRVGQGLRVSRCADDNVVHRGTSLQERAHERRCRATGRSGMTAARDRWRDRLIAGERKAVEIASLPVQ
jgi:hypothetical protein